MRSKTLIAMAVAGALGSAAAFAAPLQPVSVDENTPWLSHTHRTASMIPSHTWNVGASSSQAGATVTGSVASDDSLASITTEETDVLALADEGIYTDFYRVSFEPIALQQWDYYMISPVSSDEYAASEDLYVLTPAYEFIVFTDSDDMLAASDEMSSQGMLASLSSDLSDDITVAM